MLYFEVVFGGGSLGAAISPDFLELAGVFAIADWFEGDTRYCNGDPLPTGEEDGGRMRGLALEGLIGEEARNFLIASSARPPPWKWWLSASEENTGARC